MKCSNALPLLDLLSDNALDTKDSALVLDHLNTCSSCQQTWSSNEALRARFQQAKHDTQVPHELMNRISDKLVVEERNIRSFRLLNKNMLSLVACLVVLAVPIDLLISQSTNIRQLQVASADALIDQISSEQNIEVAADSDVLAKNIGYEIKRVKLPDWQLQRCLAYESNPKHKIARFDFVSRSGDNMQLTCYQARKGTIRADGAQQKIINGKQVLVGQHGSHAYAVWSQNDRDYLFISNFPLQQLEKVLAKA